MTDEMEAIRNFIKAWDTLPKGNHPASVVADWLNSRAMHDAVRGLKDLVFIDDILNMTEDELKVEVEKNGDTMENVAAGGRAIFERATFTVWLAEQGIRNVKFKDGLYAGLSHQLFTVAIVVGEIHDKDGTLGRYCYRNETLALAALSSWDPSLSTDPEGYVKKKGF